MNPLANLFDVRVVESFLQLIKDQAIGALNLAVVLRVSHRNILNLNCACLAEFLELKLLEV
jgi:hypothetical protein